MYLNKVLVTGSKSGMGRYLFESLGSFGWDRDTTLQEKNRLKTEGVEVIIHCAFNPSPEVTSEDLPRYLADTVLLTKEISEIPHRKFIFISSVDVYPRNNKPHKEDEIIHLNQLKGTYATAKIFSEAVVKEHGDNFLILRSTAFLGPYSNNTSLKKMKEGGSQLTLTADSRVNYVRYEDVLEFIKIALEKDLQGTYNIASAENMSLAQVATIFPGKVTFGEYEYNVGTIDNTKAAALVSGLKKTSKEIVTKYI